MEEAVVATVAAVTVLKKDLRSEGELLFELFLMENALLMEHCPMSNRNVVGVKAFIFVRRIVRE